jgi:hypothetical protein
MPLVSTSPGMKDTWTKTKCNPVPEVLLLQPVKHTCEYAIDIAALNP